MIGSNNWPKTVSSYTLSLQFNRWFWFVFSGYMVLGGRLRNADEQNIILEVVQKHFKKTIDRKKLFALDGGIGSAASIKSIALIRSKLPRAFRHLVWTDEFQVMAVLVHRALSFEEPVLLVGATG